MFIDNPHDARSRQIRTRLEQLRAEGKLPDELHCIPYDQIHGLPIQAAPAVFLLGTDDLLNDFSGDAVLDILSFLKRQRETEQAVEDMAALLKEAEII